jgi:transcriptional regulator with XRE-family HTH domain
VNDLANLLIKLRGRESLRDIADRSGISHTYLSHLEKGKDPRTGKPLYPSPDTLRALSKAYNYSYEELMMVAGYIDRPESQRSRGNYIFFNICTI